MALLLAVLASAHLARAGTATARTLAAAAIAGLLLAWTVRTVVVVVSGRDIVRTARRVAGKVDRELAERIARALRLATTTARGGDPVSHGLALLHADGLVARVGQQRLVERAAASARRFRVAALVLAVASMAILLVGPLRVVEGLDVLAARKGRAPLPIDWVDELTGEVQVPRYLRQDNGSFMGFGRTRQPRGSVLTLRAGVLHADRRLVLTDGATEVPFVDDAHGAVVARWTLGDSVKLEVAARFGDVLIVQNESLEVESLADEAPKVEVQGAPRTVRLLDVTEVEVNYEVADDHGLSQVDLVLRAGAKEERRSLAKLDGQELFQRGSAVVRPNDRFIKQAFVPVQISVEARDNDPITGPKWGRSMPITVLPPAVGEAEARRFQALQGVLSAVVDQLAARLEFDCPLDGKERAVHAQHERAEHDKLQAEASRVSAELHGGLKVPRSLGALAAGRLDRIAAAIEQEHRAKSAEQARVAHEKTRIATEDAALALDTALRMVATADATQAARRLADAAEEAASGARQARGEDRDRGMTRLQASLTVLHASTQWITTLDRLGKDLGEVIGIGARRIERSMEADELHNAELAARDLAMRLRNPLPSFSGGGGRRSTEAGGMPQQGEEGEGEGEGESAQMNEQRQEVDRLAKDHGDELKALEEELARAMREGSTQELREQGREHARAVREAVRNLPSMAADSSSAEGAAAMGRESGHAMADALESGKLPEAVARGRNAVRALEQARRLAGQQHDYFGDPFRLSTELEQSKAKLERELRWAEQQLENLRKSMADKAKDAVERGAGAEEKLAQRTADAARKGRAGDGPPMPKAMLDLLDEAEKAMRESSKALKTAEVDKGTDHQREAQRLLEMAREIQGSEEASRDVGDEGDGGKGLSGGAVDIPKAEDFRGPEAFRKRVLEGLSGSGDARLRGAVRRYAEGLLR